ncbi:MAG: HU family DNA-binding protein [Gemmatimonadetes bacterium]|nr:HU family DNA-binding protein [Gemmatimonadota bacterium]
MNKAEFIDRVAENADLTRAAAARAVDAIFDTASGAISEAVHAAGSFSIPGFGKFTKKTRAARTGRNPRTGAEISIPERATVSFTAGKGLKSGTSTSRRKAAATGAAVGAVAGAATAAATAKGTKRTATAKKSSGGSSNGARKTSARSSADTGSTAAKRSGGNGGGAAKKSSGGSSSGAKKSTSSRGGSSSGKSR